LRRSILSCFCIFLRHSRFFCVFMRVRP
jgi:hypothetical protein